MEKKSAHATEQDRPDVAASREAWFAAQPDLDPERVVYRHAAIGTVDSIDFRGES